MDDAINDLYKTFANYRMGDDFSGCDCCVDPAHSKRLSSLPVRELTYKDLERYASKAMSTWGEVRHFKHFLPRLLELTIENRDDFLDLAVLFGKLAYAEFGSWPEREKDAVNRFFKDYWDHQLAQPIVGTFEDFIDTVLCALANALPSVQPFLDRWISVQTDNAKRHLAAFIMRNVGSLLKKGRLSNSFWNTSGEPHKEVVSWLVHDIVLNYLGDTSDPVLGDDFSYARPQLSAIRAKLGNSVRS